MCVRLNSSLRPGVRQEWMALDSSRVTGVVLCLFLHEPSTGPARAGGGMFMYKIVGESKEM
jgi:hypothetical protein